MDIPWLRVQILSAQGQALLMLHDPYAALTQYKEALALLEKEPEHEAAPAMSVRPPGRSKVTIAPCRTETKLRR